MKAMAGWITGAGAGVAAVAVAATVYTLIAGPQEPEAALAGAAGAPPAAAMTGVAEEPAAEPAVITDFRAERDGMVVVAGRAAAGSDLAIRVDGAEVARLAVGSDGQFAEILMLPAAAEPRALDLVADPDGAAEAGDQVFLLAPAVGPAIVDAAPAAPATVAGEAAPTLAGAAAGVAPVAEAPAALALAEQDPPQTAPENPPPAAVEAQAPAVVAGSSETAAPNLLLSAEGVSLASAAPDAPAAVALDVIAYDPGGEVRLSGRAPGEGHVRIYLDNDPRAVTPIVDGGWGVDLPDVAPGVYTLRADQVDDAGRVTSRIESPFLREPREALAASLPAPEAGAAMRVVQPGHSLWAIARDRYGEGVLYVEVFAANRDRIRNPDLIYPGQIFVLPDLVQ